jgi:hypothetical protein
MPLSADDFGTRTPGIIGNGSKLPVYSEPEKFSNQLSPDFSLPNVSTLIIW